MDVSKPDGCHDFVNMFIVFCIIYLIIYTIGLITGPRHENVAMTKELCQEDSDGDGLTNGEELGDPCCTWDMDDVPSNYMASFVPTHPGV